MNRLISLIFIISLSLSSYSQHFEGIYKNKSDSLSFSNNTVTFCLSDFSALSTQIVGEGTYEFTDNYLIINTDEYSGNKTKLEKSKAANEGQSIFKVLSTEGYTMQGILIEFLSSSNKVISQAITDNEGQAKFPDNDKIVKVKISSMGYNGIEFDSDTDYDYSVVMVKNNIIQNQTVVLELVNEDENSLSVRLLSDNFKDGKNRSKDLEKLYKKAEKLNVLGKRLTKEYISEFYSR